MEKLVQWNQEDEGEQYLEIQSQNSGVSGLEREGNHEVAQCGQHTEW